MKKQLKQNIAVRGYGLPPALQQKALAKMQEEKSKDLAEQIVRLNKSLLDDTVDIREKIANREIREVSVSAISFIFDFFSLFFERHPKLFKSKERQEQVLEAINNAEYALSTADSVFSDKSRETFQYKTVVLASFPEDIRDIMKKRFRFISAIVSILAIFDKLYPFETVISRAYAVFAVILLIAYGVLSFANEGRLVLHVFKVSTVTLRLTLRDYIAIRTYLAVEDVEKLLLKRRGKGMGKEKSCVQPNVRPIYEYEFPREVKKLTEYRMYFKRFEFFVRWKM